jgi:protein subunit release factor A
MLYNNFQKTKKMETIYVELRDAEGGKDAKLLVEDMRNIYIKTAKRNNFK